MFRPYLKTSLAQATHGSAATNDNMQQIQWTDTFDYSGCELSLQSSNNFPLSKDEKSSSKMSLRLIIIRCGRVMADNIAYAKFRESLLI